MSSAAHLVAFLETLDASTGYTGIAALADSYCVATGTDSLVPRDASLLAAYLGGAGLLRGRVQAPSLLRAAHPHQTPFQAAIATATGLSRVTDFSRRPLRPQRHHREPDAHARSGTDACGSYDARRPVVIGPQRSVPAPRPSDGGSRRMRSLSRRGVEVG